MVIPRAYEQYLLAHSFLDSVMVHEYSSSDAVLMYYVGLAVTLQF